MKRSDGKRHARQLVILTGLSGSGKGSVLNTFEDLGFYCVDNFPVAAISTFSELYEEGRGEVDRAALLVDAREGEQIEKLPGMYRKLGARTCDKAWFWLKRVNTALQRRFNETRRPHPLGRSGSIIQGYSRRAPPYGSDSPPARTSSSTRRSSTYTSCASLLSIASRILGCGRCWYRFVSFGFRYGIPADADLVFDVRFLPNPHFVPRLRPFDGRNSAVARYIKSFPQTEEFRRRIESLLTYLIPHYIREGKSYLTVAFGCTGGRHRSVALAEMTRRALQKKGYATKVVHRDLDKSAS